MYYTLQYRDMWTVQEAVHLLPVHLLNRALPCVLWKDSAMLELMREDHSYTNIHHGL